MDTYLSISMFLSVVHELQSLPIFGLLILQFFGRQSSADEFYTTTLSDEEQRQQWQDEFARLQTVTHSELLDEIFSSHKEEFERTQNTPEIDLYSPSAEQTRYWWESMDEAPDYPDEPHIKAGMFTGTTITWPEEKTNGTTEKTTFRFTKFKHKIPGRLIGKLKRREEAL